ncbi:hypothetical protein M5689_010484 [Euphorbia peplus]|nr:hypothetical protein M5689_010484 [Euphorbia peplus]
MNTRHEGNPRFSSLQIGFSTYSPTDLHHLLFELPSVTTSPPSTLALPSTVTINPQTAPPLSNSIRPLLLICFTVAYDEAVGAIYGRR